MQSTGRVINFLEEERHHFKKIMPAEGRMVEGAGMLPPQWPGPPRGPAQ